MSKPKPVPVLSFTVGPIKNPVRLLELKSSLLRVMSVRSKPPLIPNLILCALTDRAAIKTANNKNFLTIILI